MIAYYFVFFFLIFVVSGLHFSSFYNNEKPLLTSLIFTFLSIGFVFLAKQNFELLDMFSERQDIRFIPKEKIFEKNSGRKRKRFIGFSGEILMKDYVIKDGFLPTQTYYNLKDEKLTIDDTLKVWYLGENDNLIIQTEKTKANNFLVFSIIEQIFIIILCNSLWFWVLKKNCNNN